MSEPIKTEEPTSNNEEEKNSKPEESKDSTDGRESPSSDPLLNDTDPEAAPSEEKNDQPKTKFYIKNRKTIMGGIASLVLLIIGIVIVVWYCTAEEPDFVFDGSTPPFHKGVRTGGPGGALDVRGIQPNFSGCEGQLIIRPTLKRPDIEVDHDQEIGKKFHIRMNRRKSKKKIDHVISKGNCCWEISDRHGNKETLGVGVGRDTKNVKYISTEKISSLPKIRTNYML